MKILLIEPFYTGSHAAWAEGLKKFSSHDVHILSMQGSFWKWRMHGGAVTMAKKFLELTFVPDLIVATDMLDLTSFLALTRDTSSAIPVVTYFHENQLSYPWSPEDKDVIMQRDKHYGFINYTTALSSDQVYFNSAYHRESFLVEVHKLLNHFPDHTNLESVHDLRTNSSVLPLGLDLTRFDAYREQGLQQKKQHNSDRPLILWNHRWQYDKNPAEFVKALSMLAERDVDFGVILLGQRFGEENKDLTAARKSLGDRIVHYGFVEDFAQYATWLWQADIIPITNIQDFFGASLVEALYCNTFPLVPNRLAYSEIVSTTDFRDCYYQNFDELVAKLQTCILNLNEFSPATLRQQVTGYSWEKQIATYDNNFQQVYDAKKLGVKTY